MSLEHCTISEFLLDFILYFQEDGHGSVTLRVHTLTPHLTGVDWLKRVVVWMYLIGQLLTEALLHNTQGQIKHMLVAITFTWKLVIQGNSTIMQCKFCKKNNILHLRLKPLLDSIMSINITVSFYCTILI